MMMRIFAVLLLISIGATLRSTDHAVPFTYNSCRLDKPHQGESLFVCRTVRWNYCRVRSESWQINVIQNDTEKHRLHVNYKSLLPFSRFLINTNLKREEAVKKNDKVTFCVVWKVRLNFSLTHKNFMNFNRKEVVEECCQSFVLVENFAVIALRGKGL